MLPIVIESSTDAVRTAITSLRSIYGVQRGLPLDILCAMCAAADVQSKRVNLSFRKQLMTELMCSTQQFSNAIGLLTRQGLITRVGRGEYQLDPTLPIGKDKEYIVQLTFRQV